MNGEPERGASSPGDFLFVKEGPPVRLDRFLSDRLPGKSRSFIQKLIKEGRVSLEGSRGVKPSSKIKPEDRIRVELPAPRERVLEPRNVPFDIIQQDKDIAAVCKPPGLAVHPSPGLNHATLVNGLCWRMDELSTMAGDERPGLVHRLDKDTSGVMIIAKNDDIHQKLALKFKSREVHKRYVAVCHIEEAADAGVIDAPIGRSLRNRKKMTIRYDEGRSAITEYEVHAVFGPYGVVYAFPRSGRTHQIRVHLKFMGMPILCDAFYGREKAVYPSTILGKQRKKGEVPLISRQALHAEFLRFIHPVTGKPFSAQAALPPDMCMLLGYLRRHFQRGSGG